MKKTLLFISLILLIIFFSYNYRLYTIEGSSMNYGLTEGDRVLCDRQFQRIERGDLLVFEKLDSSDNTLFIKRCAALPGDKFFQKNRSFYLQVDGDSRKTYRLAQKYDLELADTDDGYFIKDPYLKYYGVVHNWRLSGPKVLTTIPMMKLGNGEYYMLGDYRDNSEDSRFFGSVGRKQILSKVIYLFKRPIGWMDLLKIKEVD